MIKRYKSTSHISFNIFINQKRKRISFDAFSRGGSEYITDCSITQQAIESQPFFGSLVTLAETTQQQQQDEQYITTKDNELTPVTDITNCADAKTYLFEKGVTTALRSKEQIRAIASELGIYFIDLK